MSRKTLTRRAKSRGTALMELAVTAPFLIMITFGTIDFGRALQQEIVASSAARAGVQYALQSTANQSNTAGIEQAVRNDAAGDADGTVTVTSEEKCSAALGGTLGTCSSSSPYRYLVVTASIPMIRLMSLPYLPNNTVITSVAKARIQ